MEIILFKRKRPYHFPIFPLSDIIMINNKMYQLKINTKFWKRNKKYPLIKLISKLRKI